MSDPFDKDLEQLSQLGPHLRIPPDERRPRADLSEARAVSEEVGRLLEARHEVEAQLSSDRTPR
jgi:hypothetical protein